MTNIPVFLASNDNFAPFVATAMASILYNTKSFVQFYVLDSGISDDNKRRIERLGENFSIEFIRIDISRFKDFRVLEHVSLDMYSRFLIPELKPNLEKVIYLDVDTITFGDIAQLYNEALDEYIVGAIWEEFIETETERKVRVIKKFRLSDTHKYFNSGVLLIDCKKWRENAITTKLFKIEQEYRNSLECPDQDILNIYFNNNNFKLLYKKYNYMTQNSNYYKEASPDIFIRHYNSPTKPWQCDVVLDCVDKKYFLSPIKNFDDFWFFAKKTLFYDELTAVYNRNLPDITTHLRGQAVVLNCMRKN